MAPPKDLRMNTGKQKRCQADCWHSVSVLLVMRTVKHLANYIESWLLINYSRMF